MKILVPILLKKLRKFDFIKPCSCLMMLFVIVSCQSGKGEQEVEGSNNLSKTAEATKVTVDTVKSAVFYFRYTLEGNLSADHVVQLSAGAEGEVQPEMKGEGEQVKRGDRILALQNAALKQNEASAELVKEKAELEYRNQLLGFPSYSQQSAKSRDSLEKKLRIISGLEEAKLKLAQIRQQIQSLTVTAPFSGKVFDVKVKPFQEVTAGAPLCSLYDPNQMLFEGEMLADDAYNLKKGFPVSLTLHIGNETQQLSGKVSAINPKVDQYGQVHVTIKLQDGHDLWPGMHARAEIKVPQGKHLIVPKESVVLRSGKPTVFVFEKGKAKWHYVKTGMDNGHEVTITEGVKAGDLVITSRNLQLSHDAPVEIGQE